MSTIYEKIEHKLYRNEAEQEARVYYNRWLKENYQKVSNIVDVVYEFFTKYEEVACITMTRRENVRYVAIHIYYQAYGNA